MKLLSAIEAYVSVRKAMGADFTTGAKILRHFGRTVGDLPVEEISAEQCVAFCSGGPCGGYKRNKHHILNGFFRYLVGREMLSVSPLPHPPKRSPTTFQPYIYSHEELEHLLAATTIVDSTRRWRMQSTTLRTLLLLLYGTGLRVSEALSLRVCDVDLADAVLHIVDSKFFKSRLIPIGGDLCRVLAEYRCQREALPLPAAEQSQLFVFRTGKPLSYAAVRSVFARLRELCDIRRPERDRQQPRIHDLRATFAVHRLLAWYREGANLQARLPLLATYLGHESVSGTACYLSMIPELLGEASLRFEHYALSRQEDNHD
jgi:integrase/recombinase XerD